jgi:hypothetical protein
MNKKEKKFVWKYWTVLMIIWAIDFLILTPLILQMPGFYEANPLHRFFFNKYGAWYFYVSYPLWGAMYLGFFIILFEWLLSRETKIECKHCGKKQEKRFAKHLMQIMIVVTITVSILCSINNTYLLAKRLMGLI